MSGVVASVVGVPKVIQKKSGKLFSKFRNKNKNSTGNNSKTGDNKQQPDGKGNDKNTDKEGESKGETLKEVILDTVAVIDFKKAQKKLNSGETPVVTTKTKNELNDLVNRGHLEGIPKVTSELKEVPDSPDIINQAKIRKTLGQLEDPNGSAKSLDDLQGVTGDDIIGSTAATTNRSIITGDKNFKAALEQVGVEVRDIDN